MATIISKERYQSRAKRIWQDIMKKELEHNRDDVSDLEFKLAFLQRKIAKFRTWNYQ
jgi:hypothetical protein